MNHRYNHTSHVQLLSQVNEVLSLDLFGQPIAYICGTYISRHCREHWKCLWSRLIWDVKRQDAEAIARCGLVVAGMLERRLQSFKPYVITYVPALGDEACAMRQLAAGFLAGLDDKRGVSLERLLFTAKPKQRIQHRCRTGSERWANVSGCYAVENACAVSGKNIVIVDDVITSGATFTECANCLRLAGAAEVVGIFLAKTHGW
jgi:predicted amidophosphoribosyltransferase